MKGFLKWLKRGFVPHEHNGHHPYFLRHQSISIFLLLIIIIEVGFFIQVFYVFDKTKFLAAVLPGVITSITNDERAEANLPPLKENPLLAEAAQLKAEDMAGRGYFAHVSPDGLTPWHWFGEVGYKYTYAGENLAVNFFESADVAEAWMNSPTHKANIIKENYTEIGIGVASGTYQGKHTIFVAQFFGTPLATAATPAPTTETAPAPEPEPAEVVEVTPAPEPETEVLGEEVITPEPEPAPVPEPVKVVQMEATQAPESAVTKSPAESQAKLAVEKTLSSPRQAVSYAYTAIGLLALIAVMLALFIKNEIRHPGMVARGAGLIAVIVVLSVVNLKILNIEPEVPAGGPADLSANAIVALPE